MTTEAQSLTTRKNDLYLETCEKKMANLLLSMDKLKSNEARLNLELGNMRTNLKKVEASNLILKKSLDKNINDKNHYISIIENYKSELQSEKIKSTDLKAQNELIKRENINNVKNINNKDRIISTLNMESKIKIGRIEDMTINLDKLRREKQLAEQLLKEIKHECNKSINKFRALKHKNIVLKSRITGIGDLKEKLQKQKQNEILLKDTLKFITQETEELKRQIRPLLDRIKELEGQKIKHIFTGRGMSEMLQDLQKCNIENEQLKDKLNSSDQVNLTGNELRKFELTEELGCAIVKHKSFENTIYRLKKDITNLQNKLERQKDIIHNYKNIINFNRNVQKECKKNINECKLQVENKQYDRVFCEFDKLDQEKKIDKLHIINFTKSEQIKLLQAQDTNFCLKIKELYNELHYRKKDYFNSQQTENTLKKEIETLVKRNNDYQESLNAFKENVRHTNNVQQSKAQHVKLAAYEQLQNKVYKLEGFLKEEKHKNNELSERVEKPKKQIEVNTRINFEEINNVLERNKILSRENELLTLQNKNCKRITNENKLLKMELKDAQESNDYAQNVMNALKSERELKLHSLSIPEMIWPDVKKDREIKRRLIVENVKFKSQANELKRNEKLIWRI